MSRNKPIAANYYIDNGASTGKRHLGDCSYINKARRVHPQKIVTVTDGSIPVCPLCRDRILDEARTYSGIRVIEITDQSDNDPVEKTDQGEIVYDPGYYTGRIF